MEMHRLHWRPYSLHLMIFLWREGGGGSSNTLLIVACSRLDVGRESGSRNGEAEPVSIVFSIVLVDLKTGQL